MYQVQRSQSGYYSNQRQQWRGGYDRNSYNNGGGNTGGNSGLRPQKKRTGCKSGMCKGQSDAPFVRGWNFSRQSGLVTFLATPYKKTAKHTSKSGRVWENWMVKVRPKMAQSYIVSGLYDVASGRVIINEMGLVMNPRTNYCGTFSKRK